MPAYSSAVDGGVHAQIRGWSADGAAAFWRTIFGTGETSLRGVRQGAAYVWDEMAASGAATVVVNAPADLGVSGDSTSGWRGSDLDSDFVGGSSGVVVDAAVILGRRVGWPYAMSVTQLETVADALEVGHWSGWISAEVEKDSSKGMFKVYRLDPDLYYLTPLYSTPPPGVPGDVAPDSLSPSAAQAPTHLYDHVLELTDPKAAGALELLGDDWDLFVYFDSTLASASYAHRAFLAAADDSVRLSRQRAAAREGLANVYAAVDSRITEIVERAGPGACLALIFHSGGYNGADDDREDLDLPPLGSMVVSCGDKEPIVADADVEDIAATLAYLSGLGEAAVAGEPLVEVRTRYWTPSIPSANPGSLSGADSETAALPARAESFRELGVVDETARPVSTPPS